MTFITLNINHRRPKPQYPPVGEKRVGRRDKTGKIVDLDDLVFLSALRVDVPANAAPEAAFSLR
jgi:hypothetical protein